MRRLLVGLSALFLLAAAPAARACINDREITRAEREFKSQYLQTTPGTASPSEPAPAQGTDLSAAYLAGGAVLLLGATVTVLNLRQRPRPE
jgi:hypothetical protein